MANYWDQYQPIAAFPEGPTSGVRFGDTGGGGSVTTPALPTQTPQTVAPAAAAPTPGGDDYRAIFQGLFPGDTLSPQMLAANEDKLKAAGFRLLGPNAAGMRSKIELPNGQIVDVIGGAGSGQNRSQWLVENGGGSTLGNLGQLGTGMIGSVMGGGGFSGNPSDLVRNIPGYQFSLDEALNGAQRSAAARGTLLTGGFQKALGRYLGNAIAGPAYQRQVGNLFNLAGIGENAAAQTGNAAGAYSSGATGTLEGLGNAQGQGALNSGNAWANGINGAFNNAATSYLLWQQRNNPNQTTI